MNALCIHPKDNVVTCVERVAKGETVLWSGGLLVAEEEIPSCHKVAIADIPLGGEVIKYGEVIGKAKTPIARGFWVSDRNIQGTIRNYDEELVAE